MKILIIFLLWSIQNTMTVQTQKTFRGGCLLLNHPPNGQRSLQSNSEYVPNTPVNQGTVISVKCNDGYRPIDLNNVGFAFCINGEWIGDIEDNVCERICPPLNDWTIFANCTKRLQPVNCLEAVEGTTATIQCISLYSNEVVTSTIWCNNGQWTPKIKPCGQVCGEIKVNTTSLIGKTPAVRGEYPWVVAIYTIQEGKYIYICGGSIISRIHILAAAHCFINVENEEDYDKDKVLVIAGKFFQNYDDDRDTATQQIRKIKKLMVHEYFREKKYKRNYHADIAVLEVTEEFKFGSHVQPVCIDWNQKYDEVSLRNGSKGIVATWELAPLLTNSEKGGIQTIALSVHNPIKCSLSRQYYYKRSNTDYYTADKICAGHIIERRNWCTDTDILGFYFESNGKYYIRGISSLQDYNFGCETEAHAWFTRVSAYHSWLAEKISKHLLGLSLMFMNSKINLNHTEHETTTVQPISMVQTTIRVQSTTTISEDCLLLDHPSNGQRSFINGGGYTPNILVTHSTTVMAKCSDGYRLTDTQRHGYAVCNNGIWYGDYADNICQKTCAPLEDSTYISTCIRNSQPVNCSEAVHGTRATIECTPFYTAYGNFVNKINCKHGRWTPPFGACEPVCGEKKVGSQTLIIGGSRAVHGEYPWIVAVYHNEAHICGGSIILPKYVLSAAHCFTNLDNGEPNDKSNYMLIAGKYYRGINDDRDKKTQQVKKIKKIIIHDDYRGQTQNYLADVALLEIDEQFKLNLDVQPVCIDWNHIHDEISLSDGNTGVVTGWGYTSEGSDPAAELKKAVLPVHSKVNCKQHLPLDFYNKFYISDKICAGFIDNATSICSGDSGGGYYFQSDRKFYIRGIVSLAPQGEAGCNKKLYGLFTRVSKYSDWIREKINTD